MSDAPFLYPSITSLPSQQGVGQSDKRPGKAGDGKPGEFDRIFEHAMDKAGGPVNPADLDGLTAIDGGLNQVKQPLKFSSHAAQRLRDRKITFDQAMMAKVNDAVDKADAKGLNDTLVLTPDAALIVNVRNRTVITAMDRNAMNGNVFTNIDGAVIV